MMRGRILIRVVLLFGILLGIIACKKDYYLDTGLQSGWQEGSTLDFLKSKPFYFDTLVNVVKLAEMEDVLQDSSITFFAPSNYSITKVLQNINRDRYNEFKDSLQLKDIPAEVWKKFLSRYIFHGEYLLKDISRKDLSKLGLYPGMNLESWDGYIMNIGVRFADYNGVKEMGPRRVMITSVGDLFNPDDISNDVASSDIRTKNGVVHVIDDLHVFGFGVDYLQVMIKDYID